jgi:hypothetical protein
MRLSTENKTLQDNFGNFPFICSNIPIPPAENVYLSQLVRRYNACVVYHDGGLLSNKLFLLLCWSNPVDSIMVETNTWSNATEDLCHRVPRVFSVCRSHNRDIPSFSFIAYYRTFTTMTSATSGAVTAYTSTIFWGTFLNLFCLHICLLFLFYFADVLSLLRITAFDKPVGVLKFT